MPAPKRPIAPGSAALPMAAALGNSAPLAKLLQRLHESRGRFADIRHLLPPDLLDQTKPGPLSEDHWCLLAANGAAAAKLRQWVPRFEAELLARGWQGTAIRIKVQTVSPSAAKGN